MEKLLSGVSLRQLRLSLGLNQTQFWERIGVTQSAGSRYESGRSMPESVHLLVRLAYGALPLSREVFARLRYTQNG